MKRCKNLFDKIASFENLILAAQKAQKAKRFKDATALFNLNLEKELLRLEDELKGQTYKHSPYRDFFIFDPKRRLISAAPYRDRVVHHALCNVIEPLFDRTFIHDSYACRKNKGTHAAVRRYTTFARKNRYVLKCDIKKYFQTIDHEILFRIVCRKIKCEKTLWLVKEIIGTRSDKSVIMYFKNDDLFTPFNREKGIPIGNLTSQFFANVYLNGFDHFVKESLKCKYFIRYVDDFVVFDNEKTRLHDIKAGIKEYLESLRLCLHERKSRICNINEGVTFLGYRIFPTHRLLKKGNILHMRRKLRKLKNLYHEGTISFETVNQSIQSWIGHARHADTFMLRQRLLEGMVLQRGKARDAARRLVEQQP